MTDLYFIILALAFFYFDQLLMMISGWLNLSIAIPVILIFSIRDKLPRALVVAFIFGLLSDLTSFRAVPIMAVFLLFEVVFVHLIARRYIEVSLPYSMALIAAIFCLVQIFAMALFYSIPLSYFLLISAATNILLSMLVVFIFGRLAKRSMVGK